MAMTQIEQIRALDETLRWFERELQWGVSPRDLEHLVIRIGRIFTAINCNGQLVNDPDTAGYCVVGSYGERYQVQCIVGTEISGEINVTREQLESADRVAVLFFNSDELEIDSLLDASVEELAEYVTHHLGNKLIIPLESLLPSPEEKVDIRVVRSVIYKDYTIRELENGDMEVDLYGNAVVPAKQVLQKIAVELDIQLFNGMERSLNTRQLGTQVIHAVELKNQKV